jgi:DUF3017 family protein
MRYGSPEHQAAEPGNQVAAARERAGRSSRGRPGGGRHHAGRRGSKRPDDVGLAAEGQRSAAGQPVTGAQPPAAGQVPGTARVPAAGRVPGAARVPAAGQVPGTARVPAAGRVPGAARVPAAGQIPETGQIPGDGGAGHPPPLRFAQLPYVALLIGIAGALAIVGQGVQQVRSGTFVFAGVLLMAALARLVLPERRAGMLSSRRRLLDVAIFGVLGIGLLVGALVVPVPG